MSRATNQSWLPLGFFLAWLAITVMWWVLALAPLPARPPAWLVVARQVCFGATPTGLPAGYGWLGLFAVPGSLLGFLLVVWGRQLRGNMQTLRRTTGGRLVIGAMLLVPVVGALWVGQRLVTATQMRAALSPPSQTGPLPAQYPRLDQPAPELQLIDQYGRVTALDAQRGKMLLLTFAFGHCSTICSTVVQTARQAVDTAAGISPGLWVVTLDPWRDTPGALPGLAARWRLDGDNLRVLSGAVDGVLTVLEAYNVPHQRNPKTGDITHPALVYVIAADGRIAYALTNPSRAWLVEALRRAARPETS